jgi:tRNA threonylcarbamoyladenosine biosynthesis protein TsaE
MGGRSRVIALNSAEETFLFGQHAARVLDGGKILALSGPLGAGKTSFVQGLGLGLGIASPIQSPTFTYFHLYDEGRIPLYHFDLYRLKDAADFFAMGFEEYFTGNGITAIEWPERLGAALPATAVSLQFSHAGSGRNVDLSSSIESDLINLLAAWD